MSTDCTSLEHTRYSSFITSIWESLLLTSFFTSPKRSIIGNLKTSGCKEGLDGDRVSNAFIPHIETSVQKSRAYIWVQRKKCNQKILLHVLQGLSLPHYAKAKYTFHSISSPLQVFYMIYIHFLQSPLDKYLYNSVLNSMKGEVSSRRFCSRQLLIAHQDETGLQTFMQNV